MTKREPGLELLLRGGDLIAASPLSYDEARRRMLAALRDWVASRRDPRAAYSLREPSDPGIALIEALAACIEVMGFYHDRILTESKLGAAQRLAHVARLGEFVGYRPSPPLAATARQFFEAVAASDLPEGTRVAGRGGEPPSNVVFRTRAAIRVGPAFNRLALSPIVTREAGALRAILTLLDDERAAGTALAALAPLAERQGAPPPALPSDDFRAGLLAMINGPRGLELCPVDGNRRRGVAFRRPLLRSYDERATAVSRATRARRLRFEQPLGDHDAPLVAFEVSREPILHLPDPGAPPSPKSSTLELFVFDEPNALEDVAPPNAWDPKSAWVEVPDFSASEASDRHYRTFVDDRLFTYAVLRRRLGYRTLLDERALGRVHVRYAPAIGRVVEPPPDPPATEVLPPPPPGEPPAPQPAKPPALDLEGVTMRLDRAYFETALVRPEVEVIAGQAGAPPTPLAVRNAAGWAVTETDLGLAAGEQIVVLGGPSDRVFVRTLAPRTSGRYLQWCPVSEALPEGARPVDEHKPIEDVFDLAKAKIAPLEDAARGQSYPLWDDYYKQAREPSTTWTPPTDETKIPEGVYRDLDPSAIEQRLVLHRGSTFLLLGTSSYVKSGDFLLVGRRLKNAYRRVPEETTGKGFDEHAPWLTAEVLQAVEVQGNLVRLRDPVSQNFYEDRKRNNLALVTEVVVVPRVASVYYGDRFAQKVMLTNERTFTLKDSQIASSYIRVPLDKDFDRDDVRAALGLRALNPPPVSGSYAGDFDQLFLAVSGAVTPVTGEQQTFYLDVPKRGLEKGQVAALWLGPALPPGGTRLTDTPEPVIEHPNIFRIAFANAQGASNAADRPEDLLLIPKADAPDLRWGERVEDEDTLGPGKFRVASEPASYFLPKVKTGNAAVLSWSFLKGGGTLLVDRLDGTRLHMEWGEQKGYASGGLQLKEGQDPGDDEINAVAIRSKSPLSTSNDVEEWYADWSIPTNFANSTNWIKTGVGGNMILEGTSRTLPFVYNAAKNRFELRDVRVRPASGESLDPIQGATRLWALPPKGATVIPRSAVTAEWTFQLGPFDQSPFGSGQKPFLLLDAAKVVLRDVVVKSSSSSTPSLVAKIDGDARQIGADTLRALLSNPATAVPRKDIWHWTGSTLDPAPIHGSRASVEFAPPTGGLRDADVWWADGTLRLVPDESLPAGGPDRAVNRMVHWHAKGVKIGGNAVYDSENERTVISFFLPAQWPGGATPLGLAMREVPGGHEIIPTVELPVDLGNGAWEFVFEGDKRDTFWSHMFLVFRDWPDLSLQSIRQVGALAIPNVWKILDGRSELGLFFTSSPLAAAPEATPIPADSEYFDVAGFLDSQGNVKLLAHASPSAFKPFPQGKLAYLAFLSVDANAPEGETLLRVDDPPANIVPAKIGFLGLLDGTTWTVYERGNDRGKYSIPSSQAGVWTLRLHKAASEVFTQPLLPNVELRLAYDLADTTDEVSTGLGVKAILLEAALVKAGVNSPVGGVNAALFYGDDIAKGLISSFVPKTTNWALESSVLPEALFDVDSRLQFSTIGFGQRFKGLLPESISVASLVLELGSTPSGEVLKLAAGDVLSLVSDTDPEPPPGGDDPSAYAEILQVVVDGTRYKLGERKPPDGGSIKAVRLRALRFDEGEAKFGARIDFALPTSPPPLWLLSFVKTDGPIFESLLRYQDAPVVENGRVAFTFDDAGTKALLPDRGRPLYFYTDQMGQLRRDLYVAEFDRPKVDPDNFLKRDAKALLAFDRPELSLANTGILRVLLASKAQKQLPPAGAGAILERLTQVERTREFLTVNVYSESIVFNSGNFIPVNGMLSETDDKVIKNALRVELRVGKDGVPLVMTYRPELTQTVEEIEADTFQYVEPLRYYSFNKVPGGAFTLNFLVVDTGLANPPRPGEEPIVTVHVEYGADRKLAEAAGPGAPPPAAPPPTEGPLEDADTGPAEADQIYAFETWSKELEPRTQLVALDSGGLKPDDYLFLHGAADASGVEPPVYWTRITSVIGPVVRVWPAVPFELANFRRYTLRGLSKPPRPAGLDKGYYATLAGATLRLPSASPALPLGDRLVLDRVVDEKLLSTLVPGDRLLVWDEHHREAWRRHRVGLEAQDNAPPWFDWPDFQHEAVVKDVDAATGLVVLAEPLPERFAVYFAPPPLAPDPSSGGPIELSLAAGSPSLRVLPHYRAPFQGERALMVLGSGDKGRRFARYTGVLPTSPGLASVPLARPDTHASNVEVFTRDARSGEWVRWIEFTDIDRAKKDPAFVLGLDAQALDAGKNVPFSVSFGDGKDHGLTLPTGARNVFARTTAVGPWTEHVARRRGLNVLSVGRFALTDLPFEVPPEATAAAENLRLLVEAGDPAQWGPAGKAAWWPALSIETVEATGAEPLTTTWREVSQEEVCKGSDGVWVRGVSPPLREGDARPPRPGVVEVFFFRRTPVNAAEVRAWAAPEGRVWALDAAMYQALVAQDPTRVLGSTVLQALETEGIGPGSLLAFSQAGPETSPPEIVRVDAVDPDTWVVTLDEETPLGRTYALGSSFLRGNLGDVVQGDVVRSFIGSGDGSTRDLRLPLQNRERLLHRAVEGSTDPEPDVDVLVDGAAWTRVADLSQAGPRDRVYRLDVDPDGVGASVVFGDGKHGAVPPPGTNNIEAAFATGDGRAGNLPKGAIDRLIDGNLAVKATSNLVEASGGRPGDTVDDARTKLLGRNVGFDRIVTLEDVARVAREEVGEVLHARVDPTAPKGELLLAVALRDRREPTAAMLEGIRQGVVARMPAAAGVELKVTGAVQVPVYVVVEVGTAAGHRQADVLAALERAFSAHAFFAAERWPLAEPLRLGDLYEAVFAVRGVSSARVVWMNESQPPEAPKGPTPERVDPGPRGVIRCDNDAAQDPNRERGSIRFRPKIAEKGTP